MAAGWTRWLKLLSSPRRVPVVRRPATRFRPRCLNLEARETPAGFTGGINLAFSSLGAIHGAGPGGVPIVSIANPLSGGQRSVFNVLAPGFTGGAHVAGGDATNPVIVGAGQGGVPVVQVFDRSGNVRAVFLAFDATFTGGVRVAAGDVTGDGVADIIAASGPGGPPIVRVFNGTNMQQVSEFMPFDVGFTGGVTVAVAELTGDSRAEIVVGAGAGGFPIVRVFDASTNTATATFLAFDRGFTGGVTVAAHAASNGQIAVGAGPGGRPIVRTFSDTGTQLREIVAFPEGFNGGVGVAFGNANTDGVPEIAVSALAGGLPIVRMFDGAATTATSLADYMAFEGAAEAFPADPIVDATNPVVTITSPGQNTTVTTNPTIQGTVTDNVAVTTFEASVDGGTFNPVTFANGTFTFTTALAVDGSATGAHMVAFRARDAAGNTGTASFSFTLSTDTTLPTLGTITPADGVTVTTAPTFTGTASDNLAVTAVEASVDGGTFNAVTFTNGTFTFTPSVTAGQHTVAFRARDAAGNVSTVTSRTFTLTTADTIIPVVTVTSPADGGTFPTSPAFTGTATDNIAVVSVQASVDGGTFNGITLTNGTFTFTPGVTTNGPHTVAFRANDAAGNVSTVVTRTFTLNATPADTEIPVVAITGPAQDGIFATNPTITGTLTDNVGVTALEVSVDAGNFVPATFTGGTFSFTTGFPTDGTATGPHSVAFRARDAAGNVSVTQVFSFRLNPDATRPVVAIDGPTDGGTLRFNPTITGTLSDNVAVTRLELRIDNDVFFTIPFTGGTFSYTADFFFDGTEFGAHTLDFRARDAAGNVSTLATYTFTLVEDTENPEVTVTTPGGQTFPTNPAIAGTATDDGQLASVEASVDGGAFVAVSFDPDTGAFTFTPAATANGAHTVNFRATDVQGNVSDLTAFTYTLDLDATAPTVTITAPTNNQVTAVNPTVTGTVADNIGVTTLEVRLDGGAFATVTFDAATGAFTYTPALLLDGSADGSHLLEFRATDAAGNVSDLAPLTFISASDTVAPTVVVNTPPNNTTVATNPTFAGIVTDNNAVVALEARVDNGAFVTVVFDPATGAFNFTTALLLDGTADGAHTVTFRATDRAGNVSTLLTRTFDLRTDTEDPVLTIVSPMSGQTFNANVTVNGTASDNRGVAFVQVRVDGGQFLAVNYDAAAGTFSYTTAFATNGTADGVHTLEFRATDTSDNIATLVAFTLTLATDTVAPVVAVTSPPDGATVFANPTFVGTVTDNAVIAAFQVSVDGGAFQAVTFNPSTGAFSFTTGLPVDGTATGPHTVTFRAVDLAGNVSTLVTRTFTLAPDVLPPTVTVTSPADGVTVVANPTFQGTVTDNGTVAALQASVDGGAFQTVTFNPATGAFSFTTTFPVDGSANGAHTVTFRAVDATGNVSTLVTRTFTLATDTTAPVVTIASPANNQTFNTNPTVTGTVTDNGTVVALQVQLDGGAFANVSFNPATGAFSFTPSLALDGSANGTHTLTFRAVDATGNVSLLVVLTFTLNAP